MQKDSGLPEASPCLMQAWGAHQAELRGWLHQRLPDTATAQDLLQDVFLKALRQGQAFCGVANARAWLFEVTRNTLTDHLRRQHPTEHWTEAELDSLPSPPSRWPWSISSPAACAACLPSWTKPMPTSFASAT